MQMETTHGKIVWNVLRKQILSMRAHMDTDSMKYIFLKPCDGKHSNISLNIVGDPSQAPHSHFYFGSLAVALKHRYKSGFIFQLLMTILAHLNTVADRWDRMLSCRVFHLHHAHCR